MISCAIPYDMLASSNVTKDGYSIPCVSALLYSSSSFAFLLLDSIFANTSSQSSENRHCCSLYKLGYPFHAAIYSTNVESDIASPQMPFGVPPLV
jgi:hypothetical protein